MIDSSKKCSFYFSTNAVLDFVGHLGSVYVDEIAVGDDLGHCEDDGIEIAQEPHHDTVVTNAGEKVKNKKIIIQGLRVRTLLFPLI